MGNASFGEHGISESGLMKPHFGLLLSCFVIMTAIATAQTQATYFTYRTESLKQQLNLTAAQLAKFKPLVEQETGELMQEVCNPATSRKHQLARMNDILQESERRMRPALSAEQYQQLPKLREKIIQELKSRKSAHGCTMDYWGRK